MTEAVVLEVFSRQTDEILWVEFEGGSRLGVTPEHEVWAEGRGWILARDLHPGDRFRDVVGMGRTITSIRGECGAYTVYNFEVSGAHTYFVDGVWVHNCDGRWEDVNEAMSDRARIFQEFITGHTSGQAFVLNGVKFDGIVAGRLLDAKGPSYARILGFSNSARDDLVDQARRQIQAARGTPIVWSVQEAEAAQMIESLLDSKGLTGIEVWHVPGP